MTLEELEKNYEITQGLLKEYGKRLQTIEDMEEIKKLHYQYVNGIMFCQWDDIIDLFTEDSTFDFTGPKGAVVTKGKSEIEKIIKEGLAKMHIGKEGDVLVHPVISVDGNKATGKWVLYMMYFHPHTYQSLLWVQGIYDCEYSKINGQWKFSYLKFRPRIEPPDGPPDQDYLINFLTKIST